MNDNARPLDTPALRLGPLAALCVLALAAMSLPLAAQTRSTAPVNIQADRAQMDERTGEATYSGSVIVTQGAMTLWADEIIIHTVDRRPVRIEADGKPVRAESPDLEGQKRIATASKMEYTFDSQVLVLLREARVQTVTEDTRGERITYDLANDLIQVEGSEGQRVQITIQPREER